MRDAVTVLYARGLSPSEIARRLDLAPSTVAYHVERSMRAGTEHVEEQPAAAVLARTRDLVAGYIAEGLPHVEIARRLGICKSTVSYHARRVGAAVDERCGQRYDWEAIQRHYDEGHSVRECMRAFGFSSSGWSDAVRRGAIIPRPSGKPFAELLVAGTYRGRHNLKLRLLKAGLKDDRCESCGLTSWRGESLSMALHHLNGDRLDNRLENLQLLCPNCHSQTNTYSGRNGHRRPASS